VDYVAAIGVLVAVVVGGVSVYYARFGRKQHALDEGLKRAEVCAGIARFLGVVSVTGQAPQDALDAFNRVTEPNVVRLLFDPDGRAYVAELRAKAHDLRILGAMEPTMPGHSLTMKRLDLVEWLTGQESELGRRLGCEKSIGR
jgi:hypothetical protein